MLPSRPLSDHRSSQRPARSPGGLSKLHGIGRCFVAEQSPQYSGAGSSGARGELDGKRDFPRMARLLYPRSAPSRLAADHSDCPQSGGHHLACSAADTAAARRPGGLASHSPAAPGRSICRVPRLVAHRLAVAAQHPTPRACRNDSQRCKWERPQPALPQPAGCRRCTCPQPARCWRTRRAARSSTGRAVLACRLLVPTAAYAPRAGPATAGATAPAQATLPAPALLPGVAGLLLA
jgi:hypothetical protein